MSIINYRKCIYLSILILLAIVILLRFIQQAKYCHTLSVNDQIRVSKRLIATEFSDTKIKKILQAQFVVRNIEIGENSPKLALGDLLQVNTRVQKITLWGKKNVIVAENKDYYRNAEGVKVQSRDGKNIDLLTTFQGCEITLTDPVIASINKNSNSGIYPIFLTLGKMKQLRNYLLHSYTRHFTEPHASLAYGVLFGETPNMPAEFYDSLIIVGVLHVVAASGYNVAIITAVTTKLLMKIVHNRRIVLSISILAVGLYMFFAGFSPSIVRAGIMGILIIFSQVFGRVHSGEKALLVTILLMLMVEPYLIANASFQLSVASTLGILTLVPVLRSYQTKFNPKNASSIWYGVQKEVVDTFITTFCATIMTMPIILFRFGQVSLISLVANTALLWLIPILMSFSALFMLSAVVVPWMSPLFALPTWAVAQVFIFGVRNFERVPFASKEFVAVPFWIPVGWYLCLASVWYIRRRRHAPQL